MAKEKPKEPFLVEALRDPEGARLVTEILEGLRSVTESLGNSQPVVEALANSFAIMDNPQVRTEYDELRLQLMRYVESLDSSELQPRSTKRPKFHPSPAYTPEELSEVARLLTAALSKSKKSQ